MATFVARFLRSYAERDVLDQEGLQDVLRQIYMCDLPLQPNLLNTWELRSSGSKEIRSVGPRWVIGQDLKMYCNYWIL